MNSPKTFRRQFLSRPLFAAVMVIITELYGPLAPAKGCPADADSKLPILSRVNQVRELPRDQAALGYRVRLRGVVTYYDPEWFILFVQDSTGGIYVYPKGIALSLRPGQQVEIEGFTESGRTAPIVVKPRVRVLGRASPPDPKRVSIDHLITGSEDSQWVETDAVVRSVTEIGGQYLQLDLASGGGRLKAIISNVQGADPARFVDAKVRVRGVCGTRFDEKQQPIGFLLYVPDLELVNVLEQPPPDPFGVQAYSIAGLAQLPANPTFARRVKVQGIVTLQRSGRLLSIRMETGGLLVETQQATSVQPGDRVEVVGFPEGAGRQPLLQDAIFRRVGTTAPPLPVKLTAKELLGGTHDAELVQFEARLLDRKLTLAEQVLVLQAGDLVLNAQLQDSKAMQKLASLREGSVLQVSGIYVSGVGQGRERLSLTLLLRSADDVVVLKAPSWWAFRRAFLVMGCLIVVILFALLWVAELRRTVREQTAFIREQLRDEEALKKYYLDVFERITDVILIYDLEGRITACNRAGAALTGYSRAEILRMKISDLMSAGYVELTREMTTGKRPGISTTAFEVEIIAKDGRRVPVEVGARLMKREGEVTGVLGVARDITERKRMEEALRESEERYRELLESVEAIVWEADAATLQVTFVSRGAERILGYSRHQWVETPAFWADHLHPEDRNRALACERDVLEKGKALSVEYRMQAADGQYLWFRDFMHSVPDPDGKAKRLGGIMVDITESREAEEALRRSEENFRRSLDDSPLGVRIVTTEGETLYANRAMLNIYGYDSIEELRTTPVKERYTPESYAEFQIRKEQRRRGEFGSTEYQISIVAKNGEVRHLHVFRKETLWNGERQFQAVYQDITERKRVERELQEKSASLERFTYAISHDLKSPLVTVKTFLGYLEQDLLSSDTGRIEKDVFYMRAAADKMGQLLDELLKILRVGRIPNPPVRVTFRELVEEALSVVAGSIAGRGAKVQVSDAPITLYGDRPRLVEIWQNLVENAVKFMGDQASPRIEIGAERRGGDAVFFVRDNGIGIDPRHQAKVFDMFAKIGAKSEGEGLGLALVKRIVESYRGTIWLESKGLGQGVCFLFTLPGAVESEEEREKS